MIVSLKNVFENLNQVKSYDKTNSNDLFLVHGKNTGGAELLLTSIYIFPVCVSTRYIFQNQNYSHILPMLYSIRTEEMY